MLHTIELRISMRVKFEGEHPDFYFEEHLCVDDLIEQLYREVEKATVAETCTCHRASVRYIGPVSGGPDAPET